VEIVVEKDVVKVKNMTGFLLLLNKLMILISFTPNWEVW